jgi:hypothetical protein
VGLVILALAHGQDRGGAKRLYKQHDFLSFCHFVVLVLVLFQSCPLYRFLVPSFWWRSGGVTQAQVGLELERDRDENKVTKNTGNQSILLNQIQVIESNPIRCLLSGNENVFCPFCLSVNQHQLSCRDERKGGGGKGDQNRGGRGGGGALGVGLGLGFGFGLGYG